MPQRLAPSILGLALAALPGLLTAQLAVSPAVLDFGSRGHNESPTEVITLKNIGAAPLAIREIRPSCSCIGIDTAAVKQPIPPGGTIDVKVSMGSGRAMGSLDKHIEILPVDPGVRPARIAARMRVFEGFSQEPRDLRFDATVGGAPVQQSFVLQRAGAAPFTLEVAGVKEAVGASPRPNPHFSARVADVPGGKQVHVTLAPGQPEGRVAANLECKVDGKLLLVPITGEVFRGIKVVPNYLNFNRVATDDAGSYLEESVLTSADGRPFRVLSFDARFTRNPVADAAIAFEAVPRGAAKDAPATEHVIRARLSGGARPPRNASFSGTVRIATDHPEKRELTLNFFGFFAEARALPGGSGAGPGAPPKK